MNSVSEKLRTVYLRSPNHLKQRVARVIDAVSNSSFDGVGSPSLHQVEKSQTAMSELEDNADSFLVLMRTLPKKHPFKKVVSSMSEMADSLAAKLTEAGTELDKILSADEQELPGVKASALGKLADLITEESGKLVDLQELTKMLATLAGRAKKEEKTTPVEHKLPGKEPGSEENLGDDNGIGENTPDAGGDEGPTPPAPGPNLSATQ